MAKIQIKNSFITSSAQITISSSLVRFSDQIRAKGITGSFSGSFAGSNMFVQGGNSFGTTAILGTSDNQALTFETNNTERARITSGGNLGVGTVSPISKLNVYGSGSNLSVLKIDGGNGTLFEVTDLLSGSLFSVNDITGLPIIEAFSNYNVIIDKITVGRGNKNVANTLPLTNTAIGYQSLNANTTGINNSAFGYRALASNTIGERNVAIGTQALNVNTTGGSNVAIGYQSMINNTTGGTNNAVGSRALLNNTVGTANNAFGYLALGSNTIGVNTLPSLSSIGLETFSTNSFE